jgi:uncharacterized repeat protein (TIGR01451 family)
MTEMGGAYDRGQIFRINTDGTGFKMLHAFSGWYGEEPFGSLIISGSKLYGMTTFGGDHGGGTIFEIQTDGTGFRLLRSFHYDQDEGGLPDGALLLNGSTLYGTTFAGGASEYGQGTIFKINTDGAGYATLHSFTGYPSDGAMPRGSLILIGSILYGVTETGGASGGGTIFKINTDGMGYVLLRSLKWSTEEGAFPQGSLILSGSTFYGMTSHGGANDKGTVFKINADGTGFGLVHSFAGWPWDGGIPTDSVTLIGSVLHGMTLWGGVHDMGAVFKVNADGTGFALLHSFAGGTADGEHPWGSLINGGQTLYGMTSQGGASDKGIIFCLIGSRADIALTESVDNLTPLQGSEINLTLTAKNYGPSSATGLKATDLLLGPAGLRYISSSPSQGAYNMRSGVWDIGSLAKNAAATLTLKVRAVKSGNTTNSASVSALNEYDPILSNNSASVTINVTPALPAIRLDWGRVYTFHFFALLR